MTGIRVSRDDGQRILREIVFLRSGLRLHVPNRIGRPVPDPRQGRSASIWVCNGADGQMGGHLNWHHCGLSVVWVSGVGPAQDLILGVCRERSRSCSSDCICNLIPN